MSARTWFGLILIAMIIVGCYKLCRYSLSEKKSIADSKNYVLHMDYDRLSNTLKVRDELGHEITYLNVYNKDTVAEIVSSFMMSNMPTRFKGDDIYERN